MRSCPKIVSNVSTRQKARWMMKRKRRTNPRKHNYFDKVMKIGKDTPRGEVVVVNVYHDDWCAIYHGGEYCNCQPDVKVRKDTR